MDELEEDEDPVVGPHAVPHLVDQVLGVPRRIPLLPALQGRKSDSLMSDPLPQSISKIAVLIT